MECNVTQNEIETIVDIFPDVMKVKSKLDNVPEDLRNGVLYAAVMILLDVDHETGTSKKMVDAFDELIKLKMEDKKHGKS
jgi:hypothetical protein